jgi:hypothetical protein
VSLQVFDEHSALCQLVQLTDADGTTPKYITQGPGQGARIDQLTLVSTSVAPAQVRISLNAGADIIMATVAVPAGAGMSSAVPAVDVIPLLAPVLAGLVLAPGTSLYVAVAVGLGAGETLNAIALGGTF